MHILIYFSSVSWKLSIGLIANIYATTLNLKYAYMCMYYDSTYGTLMHMYVRACGVAYMYVRMYVCVCVYVCMYVASFE